MPLLLLLVFILIPGKSSGSPWQLLGFDGLSAGVASSLWGGVSGPASVYYNPAGLAKNNDLMVSTGYFYTIPRLTYKMEENPDLKSFANFPILDPAGECGSLSDQTLRKNCEKDVVRYNQYVQTGRSLYAFQKSIEEDLTQRATRPLPLSGLSVGASYTLPKTPFPIVAGVGVFGVIDPFVVIYQRIKSPSTPFFLRYDDYPHRLALDFAVGLEPLRNLRMGGGVDFLLDVRAKPLIEVALPPEIYILNPNLKDIRFFADGTIKEPVRLVPTGGIQYQFFPWLEVGAGFREEQKAEVSAEGVAEIHTVQGIDRIPIRLLTQTAFTPREIGGGGRIRFLKEKEKEGNVFLSVSHKRWSRYKPSFGISADVGGVSSLGCGVLKNLQDLPDLLSSLNIPISTEAICDLLKTQAPTSFSVSAFDPSLSPIKDTWEPALGIHLSLSSFQIATGYRFEPSPVKDQTSVYNILDRDRHIGGIYFGYSVDRYTIGIFSQIQKLTKGQVTKDPTSVQRNSNPFGLEAPDAYPDFPEPNNSYPEEVKNTLHQLKTETEGTQTVYPGYPGYTVGGSYYLIGIGIETRF
jgi:hypothetical protein